MSRSVLQRVLVLAAAALLGAMGAIALSSDRGGAAAADGPRPVPAPDGGWYTALAGSRGEAGDSERTTCGLVLTGRSLGVTHPTLPCGAKLFLSYGPNDVLTEVIDNRLKQPGRQFELTPGLAQLLGIDGTQQVRWRFASR